MVVQWNLSIVDSNGLIIVSSIARFCVIPPPVATAITTAVKALELVNGYIAREKPLIISYGRGKD